MILVITEKPNTAEPVAANRGATTKRNGYYEGNGYVVTSGFGHLVELFQPEDYDPKYKEWKLSDLPILPVFKYKVHNEAYTKTRFELIKELLPKATTVINGCDSDREGENIFWQILQLAGYKNIEKCKRLWVSDYNDGPLTEAFNKLIPLADKRTFYLSAETRQKADWLFGMNLSRVLTKSAQTGLWNFGRVQTPTLMMVCDAYMKHTNSIEVPFWKVQISLQKDGINFNIESDQNFQSVQSAEKVLNTVGASLICSKKEVKSKNEYAPALFSLSALQQEASKLFGLKMDETLEAAQSLYEKHRLTTYPRTDSRYLPESLKSSVIETMEVLKGVNMVPLVLKAIAKEIKPDNISGTPFKDDKVTSHHAIIPCTLSAEGKELSKVERMVYLLIVHRFITAFIKPCTKETTTLTFQEGEEIFSYSGTTVLVEGWTITTPALEEIKATKSQESKENISDSSIPQIGEGERVTVAGKRVVERKTQKPALLTTETLSKMMASAGKYIEDEALAKAIKHCGIGTEATRADIVKRLYELEYIEDKGKSIIPTQDGLQLYGVLKDLQIASPELTGIFEEKLERIVTGEVSQEVFLKESVELINSSIKLLETKAKVLSSTKNEKDEVGEKCPICNGSVVIGKNTFMCSNAKWTKEGETWSNSGCGFQIQRKIANKSISGTIAKELLATGTSKLIKGFSNKEGKEFDARLKLDNEQKVTFVFEVAVETKSGTTIEHCPKCKKGKVVISARGIFCSDKEECKFALWREVAGKVLTDAQLTTLLEKGKTGEIKGFKSKAKKDFSCALKLDSDFKVEFVFSK